MPSYLVQVSYSVEALDAMMKNPQDRTESVKKAVKKLGGRLVNAWFCFGDYDIVVVLEMPDNTSAAAFAIAIGAGGSCRSVKTTPLLGVSEAMNAMKKAATSGYTPVSAKK